MAAYKFRCSLLGHKSDVRAVLCCSEDTVISASRDFTARTWKLSSEGTDYSPGEVLQGSTNYVTSLAVYQSGDSADHLIYTGSNDTLIRAYSFDQTNPKLVLKGHTDTVCGLCVDKFGTLVSVSWDKTAKVWKKDQCLLTIRGHEAAVWCVLHVSGSETEFDIVTGSADRTIRTWKVHLPSNPADVKYSAIRCLRGHDDCIRSLAVLDQHRILSASNDASIRAWDLRTIDCVGEFYGHTNYVYAVATRANLPVFVSSGEDRTVCVWSVPAELDWANGKHFNPIQSIPLPCQSAWCVALFSCGDIVVGCSDSAVRIFSSDPVRQASIDGLKAYEAELASSEIQVPNAPGTGDLDLDRVPGVEALLNPGRREGQVIVIKQDNRKVCYQWSMLESRWMEIGDVVGAQSANRPMFEGKEYDFVFTVDIAEHLAPLKLPYNRTEDPWFVAQSFLQRHDLPADYLDTVAKFIIDNAGPKTDLSVGNPSEYVDPFTGNSRYIPGGGSQPGQSSSFPPQPEEPVELFFPSETFFPLKNISLGPLLGKLESFIKELSNTPDELLDRAHQFSFDMNDSDALRLTETLLTTITRWPVDKLFPLLDLLRCLVFWRQACQLIFTPDHWSPIIQASLEHAGLPSANILLVLRLMANALAADGPGYLASPDTFDCNALVTVVTLAPTVGLLSQNSAMEISARKHHQVAFATLMHNLTVLAYRCSASPSAHTRLPHLLSLPGLCIRTSLHVLSLATSHRASGVTLFHPEAVFNLLLSLGTSLLALTKSGQEKPTDELMKTRRIRFIASAAAGILLKDTDTESPGDEAESELVAWERAQKVIDYWSKTPTALPKVRSCASALLRLLE